MSLRTSPGIAGSCLRLLTCCTVVALLTTAAVPAQLAVFEDISPDSSDTDGDNPNGATGGRVNGLATVAGNANRIYAASEWGGIYRTDDGGVTWQYLPGHNPQATWDVEVDPSNTDRIYATSFYDGRGANSVSGINVSVDGGTTWTHPATANPPAAFCSSSADQTERAAYGISIDPANSANVFVGTSCGLARSVDSGATWTWVDPTPGDGADRIWDVVALGSGKVHVCGDDGHAYSANGGNSWTVGSGISSGRCRIAASPDEDYVLHAVVGTTIFETTDGEDAGGATWTQTRTNLSPQGRIPFVVTNERAGVRGGPENYDLWFGDVSLWRVSCTTPGSPAPGGAPRCGSGNSPAWDGPFSTAAGSHDDQGDLVFDVNAGVDACPAIVASDGGVYRNTDTTSPSCHDPSWEQPDVSPHGLWPYSMSGSSRDGNDDEDLYFGNQDNGLFGSIDVGEGDASWHNEVCCDGFDAEGDPNGGVYAVCCFGGGGRSNRVFRTGPAFDPGFYAPDEINYPPGGLTPTFDFPDSIHHYGGGRYVMLTRDCTPGAGGCTGADGGVFFTDDIDADPIVWTELGPGSEPPSSNLCGVWVGVDAQDDPTYFVMRGTCNQTNTTDQVWRFRPGFGAVWEQLTLPAGGFGVFTVDPSDPDLLLASGHEANGGSIYRSTNGGDSWTTVNNLVTEMSDGGEFPFRNTRGPTVFTGQNGYWQPSMFEFDPDSSLVVAGAQDAGLFVSNDDGVTWTRISDPLSQGTSGVPHLPRPRYAVFDTDEGSPRVYVGSQGRGIWRVTLAAIFADAFESGDATAWSLATP